MVRGWESGVSELEFDSLPEPLSGRGVLLVLVRRPGWRQWRLEFAGRQCREWQGMDHETRGCQTLLRQGGCVHGHLKMEGRIRSQSFELHWRLFYKMVRSTLRFIAVCFLLLYNQPAILDDIKVEVCQQSPNDRIQDRGGQLARLITKIAHQRVENVLAPLALPIISISVRQVSMSAYKVTEAVTLFLRKSIVLFASTANLAGLIQYTAHHEADEAIAIANIGQKSDVLTAPFAQDAGGIFAVLVVPAERIPRVQIRVCVHSCLRRAAQYCW